MKGVSNQKVTTPPLCFSIHREEASPLEIPSSEGFLATTEGYRPWRHSATLFSLALSVGATGVLIAPAHALPNNKSVSQTQNNLEVRQPRLLTASSLEGDVPSPSHEPPALTASAPETLSEPEASLPLLKPLRSQSQAVTNLTNLAARPATVDVADVSQPIEVIPPPTSSLAVPLEVQGLEATLSAPSIPLAPSPTAVAGVGFEPNLPPQRVTVAKSPAPESGRQLFPASPQSQSLPPLPIALPAVRQTKTEEIAHNRPDLAPQTKSLALPPAAIAIPVIPPPPTEAPVLLATNPEVAPQQRHRVQIGETLNSIAQQYGVRTASLVEVNSLTNPNRLNINQTLVIPAKSQQLDKPQLITADALPAPEAVEVTVSEEEWGNKENLTTYLTAPPRSLEKLQRDYARPNSRLAETPERQIVGMASTPVENYTDNVQISVGQEVGPQLPPLKTPDFPDAPSQYTSYIWPAQGVLTSGFGRRWGRMHRGIDVAGPIGTPVVAAASGYVISSGWNSGGFGNLIKVRHNDGSVTYYAHNHRLLVRTGDYVEQGQQIAEMGSTGRSTGPHLHFEIRLEGKKAINPMTLLARR